MLRIPSGALRCVWEVTIKADRLPFAAPENVNINTVVGKSKISDTAFKGVVESVDCTWDYMKNLIDSLYSFIWETETIMA